MDAQLWIKFPEPTRDTFAWLWQDVVSLHFKWRLYLDLYGNPDAASVLDQTARGCFNLLAESLVNDIIMSFARLTDPANTCGKDNLSIAHLLEVLSGHATPHYLGEWRTAAQLFQDRCGPFKQLRNKRIGHRDRFYED